MTITNKFLEGGEGAVASYDYTDLAEGTGITEFFGYTHKETTTIGYGLSTKELYSNDIYTKGTPTSNDLQKVLDLDFDVALNLPKTIKGKLKVSISALHHATNNAITYFIIKLRKWDGTTETEIANCQTGSHTGTSTADFYVNFLSEITVPATHFKKGETIRLTVEAWHDATDYTVSYCYLYHDPKNRNASGSTPYTTQLIFQVPFKLDA
jgi:hypothetical protein